MVVFPLNGGDILSDSRLVAQLNEQALSDVHDVAQRIADRVERVIERSSLLDLFVRTNQVRQAFREISEDLRCTMAEAATLQNAWQRQHSERIT